MCDISDASASRRGELEPYRQENSDAQDQHVCRCPGPDWHRGVEHCSSPTCRRLKCSSDRSAPDDDQRNGSTDGTLGRRQPSIQLNIWPTEPRRLSGGITAEICDRRNGDQGSICTATLRVRFVPEAVGKINAR